MNRVGSFLGAIAMSVTIPFSAAAQDGERDFQVPGRFFQPGALPGAVSQSVPIYCKDDFDLSRNPPEPTIELIERIDTLGFGGGQNGTIAFLVNPQAREEFLSNLENPGARRYYEGIASYYDRASDKVEFLKRTLDQNHEWSSSRYAEISDHCATLGKH